MAKTFRIFLSSTFGDFQAEREALKWVVWPALEHRCREKGASFEVVDLRWGVSEADGLSHETLRICLDEVAACQRLSPRPNFVMLIGDRYGWRPLPAEIPVGEFETLLGTVTEADVRTLMQRWYRRDDNAVPPHYRLLPRDEAHRDYAAWGEVENRLLQTLRQAATTAGMTPERRERYFLSATHLEIVKGTFSVPDAPEHVFSFFRDIEGLAAAGESAKRFTDLIDGKPDPDAQTLRDELRTEIRAKLPTDHCFDYRCTWTGKAEALISADHIVRLCADVQQALLAQIDHELQDTGGDALQQEIGRHAKFAHEHTQGFIGRGAELAQLMDWADTALSPPVADDDDAGDYAEDNEDSEDEIDVQPGSPPVLVHAPGGSGKSSFMAKGIAEIKARHPGAVIVSRFVGTTPDSIELISLLRGLLVELARQYAQPEDLPEGGLKELIEALPERLAWATPEKPLLLVLDALDQFAPNLETREHRWLPVELPPCVALMLSVLDGKVQEAACRRFPEATSIVLPKFTQNEGGDLLDALLIAGEAVAPERKRCLTPEQRQAVLDAFAHDGRPLYLVLAAGVARQWKSWDAPEPLPESIEALIADIVRRLHDNHGKAIADRALDYLCASRYGVSDAEMRDLLWQDQEAHAEFDQRKNPDQPAVDMLPPVIWSRIYSALAAWLATQNVGGSLLHRFFHRILGEEVAIVSLADDAQVVHQRLAAYFGDQALRLESNSGRQPNLRRLMEQPWQLIKAGQLQKAEALLTDFDFVMAKCEVSLFDDYLEDLHLLMRALQSRGGKVSSRLALWYSFFRGRKHILRRGNDAWPAHKILLQLAVEHADNSPLSMEAETWLAAGNCDWKWIRRNQRVAKVGIDFCLAVMEGHTRSVKGVLERPDGTLLSWSGDDTLRLWSFDGDPLKVLEGHTSSVNGVLERHDGTLLSWSNDHTLRLWSFDGNPLKVLEGHTREVVGVLERPDGTLLSWSMDGTLRLWSCDGNPLKVLEGHSDAVTGVLERRDGTLLSRSYDHTLRQWSCDGNPLKVLKGHSDKVYGVLERRDGTLLSWSRDGTLRLWSCDGNPLKVLERHSDAVTGVLERRDGTIVSWSFDKTLYLWSCDGDPLKGFYGHNDGVIGVFERPEGTLLSWSWDETLRLWNSDGDTLKPLEGHVQSVNGVLDRPDGTLLSWSDDHTLRLWSCDGHTLKVLKGHTGDVTGVLERPDGTLLSWSRDGVLRLWSRDGDMLKVLEGHTSSVKGALERPDGTLLSWSSDGTLRLWSRHGDPLKVFEGHAISVNSAFRRPDGTLLSWSSDCTLRLWSPDGDPIKVLEGHFDGINGALERRDGTLLSWSSDGTLRLWSSDGDPIKVLEGHSDGINGALERRDDTLLSWSSDGTLRLWSPDGDLLKVLEKHTNRVWGALERPDGTLLSWSWDGTLRLWSRDGDPLKIFSNSIDEFRYFQEKPDDISEVRIVKNYFLGADSRVCLARFDGDNVIEQIIWQPWAFPQPRRLYANGRMCVTEAGGQVCFLQLYRGNRPLEISE